MKTNLLGGYIIAIVGLFLVATVILTPALIAAVFWFSTQESSRIAAVVFGTIWMVLGPFIIKQVSEAVPDRGESK